MKARGWAQGPALRKVIRDDNRHESSTHRLVLVPPHDPELEITILAEILEPLKRPARSHASGRMTSTTLGTGACSKVAVCRPTTSHIGTTSLAAAWPLTAGALIDSSNTAIGADGSLNSRANGSSCTG